MQGDLQRGIQIARAERFDDIAVGLDLLGSFERGRVDVGREEHDRAAALQADLRRRFDAVRPIAQMHVHQHEIGLEHRGLIDRLDRRVGDADYAVAETLKLALNIDGDDGLVFDDEDAMLLIRHGIAVKEYVESG